MASFAGPNSSSTSSAALPSRFVVMATGQIESGCYEGNDSIYCRYAFAMGDDWKVMRGVEEGITQMSSAASNAATGEQRAVWNFPIDVTFGSTGVHGWPQIVISVYGSDYFGRSDMILGYGSAYLPIAPGRHELRVRTFRPIASSLLARFQSWLNGKRPEFLDSLFASKAEGRSVTRVQSFGEVKIVVDMTLQGMEALGYSVPAPPRASVRLVES